nr:hypothetical protein [Oceanococcus sp. HetDA_MAG_MS8]
MFGALACLMESWHLFGPDLEMALRDAEDKVLGRKKFGCSMGLLEFFYDVYEATSASMVEILGSRQDNTYMSCPSRAFFRWKSNVLYPIELIVERLKSIIILVLLILGGGLWLQIRPWSSAR